MNKLLENQLHEIWSLLKPEEYPKEFNPYQSIGCGLWWRDKDQQAIHDEVAHARLLLAAEDALLKGAKFHWHLHYLAQARGYKWTSTAGHGIWHPDRLTAALRALRIERRMEGDCSPT